MTMRAQAKSFTPSTAYMPEWEPVAKPSSRGRCGSESTTCSGSTAVPSPAMTPADAYIDTSNSPWGSPYWGMGLGGWPVAPGHLLAGYDGTLPDLDQFVLPDAHPKHGSSGEEDSSGASDSDFKLTGLLDLTSSLSGLLASITVDGKASPLPQMPISADLIGAPPPPPGLPGFGALEEGEEEQPEDAASPGPPPGLEDSLTALPPGLTVSELHAKFSSGGAPSGKASFRENDGETNTACPLNLPARCTTVMLRNIPNKYTQDMLTAKLYKLGYKGEVDFLYLPVDFKNKCNVGYAFLNFRKSSACTRFANEFHGAKSWEKLPGFRSRKVCEVSAARFQGCDENVARLQSSPVMVQLTAKPEWMPQIFDEDGEVLEFPTTSHGNGTPCSTTKKDAAPNRDSAGRPARAGRLSRHPPKKQ